MITGIADNEKAEIPSLVEFVSAKSHETYFRAAFAPARWSGALFNANSDGMLVRASILNGATQQLVPVTQRTRLPDLCNYSFSALTMVHAACIKLSAISCTGSM